MNNRTQWMEDLQKNISDLIARSHRRSDSSSHSREGRDGGRESRGDRGRSSERRSSHHSGGSRQPVDDFFFKPYEPSAPVSPAEEQESRGNATPSSAPKRQLAVLLGGSRKP